MNYKDLILLYPWIDLILELFKGLMPTLVALLAIFLNNSFARDEINGIVIKTSTAIDECIKKFNHMFEKTEHLVLQALEKVTKWQYKKGSYPPFCVMLMP